MCITFLLLIEGYKYENREALSFIYEENVSQEKTKNEVCAK